MNSYDNSEHFGQFFVLAAVGAGLILAGGVNFALGRRVRPLVRLLLGGTACGAAVAALALLVGDTLAAQAAGLLGGSLLATVLAGSGWVHRWVATLGAPLRTPAVLWGTTAVCGLAVVVGSAIRFEFADEALVEQDAHDLEFALGRQPNQPTTRARAATDRGTAVVLKEPQAPRDPVALVSPEQKVLQSTKLADKVIRNAGPTDESNCHGWVFTGGRFLLNSDDVELVLKENGYTETNEPQAGDVAIYRQAGAVTHTALVRYVAEGQPVLVEGKWGALGVYLHPADKSPYGTEYTFYRSSRRGHLLAGLGGTSTDPSVTAPPAVVSE